MLVLRTTRCCAPRRKSVATLMRRSRPCLPATSSGKGTSTSRALTPSLLEGRPTGTRQLAEGPTRGAKHVVVGDCDVLWVPRSHAIEALSRVVPGANAVQFVGPVIRARGPVTITHPEHGDRTLPGEACYLVTYQRVWTEQQVLRQRD